MSRIGASFGHLSSKTISMMIDSARDAMAVALITQHHSVNTTNAKELREAADKLDQLTPNIKAVIADEMKMYMEQNEAAVGITYSGGSQ